MSTTVKLRSFLGDPALKTAFVREIGAHEEADMLMKGTYGEGAGCDFRGCGIGCSLHSLNKIQGRPDFGATDAHARYPSELGLPIWLAYLVNF